LLAVANNGPEAVYLKFYSYNDAGATYSLSVSTRLTAKVRWTGKLN